MLCWNISFYKSDRLTKVTNEENLPPVTLFIGETNIAFIDAFLYNREFWNLAAMSHEMMPLPGLWRSFSSHAWIRNLNLNLKVIFYKFKFCLKKNSAVMLYAAIYSAPGH